MQPVIFPAPAELAALPWHTRDRVMRRLRAYEREVGLLVAPADGVRYRATREATARANAAWAEGVRAEARRLAGEGS